MGVEAPIEHFAMVKDLEYYVYLVALLAWLVVAYSLVEGFRRWTRGTGLSAGSLFFEGLRRGLPLLLRYGLLQARVLRRRFPGTVHALIFYGMAWLFIATILRGLDYWVGRFLVGDLWKAYKLASNVAGAMVIIGVALATLRGRGAPGRDPSYHVINGLFVVITLTGFILNGMAAAAYRSGFESPSFDPIGYVFYSLASNLGSSELVLYYRVTWFTHMLLAHLAIALIPFTNLWHIPASGANILLSRAGPPVNAIRVFEDVEERIDREGYVGIVRLSDTTWKQRMDYDACTNCMRCTEACPATSSGKVLDPRMVILSMRKLMWSGEWDSVVWEKGLDPEAIWSCLTCGACVEECPVLIHHVDTIIDVRRGIVSSDPDKTPQQALNSLYNIQQYGNIYGRSPAEREEWLKELASKYGEDVIAREGEEYDYLYWTGCASSYDPRLRRIPEAVIGILRKAGLRVAVLPEETCTGDPARRMGEELLFVEQARSVLEILSRYRFKKLLVNCPHCFQALMNDYKAYSGALGEHGKTASSLRVEHHTVAIAKLIHEGKLRPSKEVRALVTYHDPCYLGRWNRVFEEPRLILQNVKGLRIREMPRNREKSFCCGGGGGHAFFEIKRGRRVSRIRAEEAAKTLGEVSERKVVAVACPYCNTMMRAEEDLGYETRDISEILHEAIK
ncbi:MAG: 4Fe-4S dicluster domain-containing protein [Desulfurococcales archaeon]|nr:4Fe-4S dicluster domain-containing protein [Desulfurococcales archaeon]